MAAADATSTLRLGTMVLANDYRHPVLVAKEAATIDLLSGGRLELGIGAGWMTSDYEAAGIPMERAGVRVDRLTESLAVLRGLWRSEEHTSELQSLMRISYAVFCLKKKKTKLDSDKQINK